MVLGLLSPAISLLYLRRPRAAGGFLLVGTGLALLGFSRLLRDVPPLAWDALNLSVSLTGLVVCYRTVRRSEPVVDRPWYSRWTGLAAIVAAFGFAVVLIRAFAYEPFRAPSSSMLPSVTPGASLVVQKWGYGHYGTYGLHFLRSQISSPLRRGDIIVFDYPVDPSQTYIKRLVGVPGDVIEYHKEELKVNGNPARVRQDKDYLDETYLIYLERFIEKLDGEEYSILVNSNRATYPLPLQFDGVEGCSFVQAEELMRCKVPPDRYFVLGDNRNNSADSRIWGFVRGDQIIGKVVLVTR